MKILTVKVATGLVVATVLMPGVVRALTAAPIQPLTAANGPIVPDTGDIMVDRTAAAQLGKALFWDNKVGSDGNACASCHFAAGADIRAINQVNPGGEFDTLRRFAADTFGPRRSNAKAAFGPNATAVAADFPFHVLSNPADRNSAVLFTTNDVFSSQGSYGGTFKSTAPMVNTYGVSAWSGALGALTETCTQTLNTADPFHAVVGGVRAVHRHVQLRNTPSVINAAFNARQFWDGRANNVFNGVDHLGERSNTQPTVGVVVGQTPGELALQKVSIANASLASQAVAPPLSFFEMSCAGRTFADIGRKLLALRPLSIQTVHPKDSLFSVTRAPYAPLVGSAKQAGLNTTYQALIQRAFNPKYWASSGTYKLAFDGRVVADPAGYRQVELNFSLFWGLAIQEYELLLVSDRTPYDAGTLSAAARRGMAVFNGQGGCSRCHTGPAFSDATAYKGAPLSPIDRIGMVDGGAALVDAGFHNIGVTPTRNDIGVGGLDPYGYPLSFSRQAVTALLHGPVPDRAQLTGVDPCRFEIPFNKDLLVGQPCSALPESSQAFKLRTAVDGAFKVPGLRNVALTPPYMHNGGFADLTQVIDFYNRGGNRRTGATCTGKGGPTSDTSGFDDTCSNADPDMRPLGLTAAQRTDLIEFLKSLTDNRVACQQGPFDHPSLLFMNGHHYPSGMKAGYRAPDLARTLPVTGTDGLAAEGKPCFANNGDLFGTTQTTVNRIVQ